jgi:hypothetical protein
MILYNIRLKKLPREEIRKITAWPERSRETGDLRALRG